MSCQTARPVNVSSLSRLIVLKLSNTQGYVKITQSSHEHSWLWLNVNNKYREKSGNVKSRNEVNLDTFALVFIRIYLSQYRTSHLHFRNCRRDRIDM